MTEKESSQKEPWDCSNEEIVHGECCEITYDPNFLSPHNLASRRGPPGKETIVGDAFLRLPRDERRLLLLHERGHDVANIVLIDRERKWEDIMAPLKIEDWPPAYENPVGISSRPEEVLADIYMEIKERGLPDFSDRSNWSERAEKRLAPVYKRVAEAIEKYEKLGGPCRK